MLLVKRFSLDCGSLFLFFCAHLDDSAYLSFLAFFVNLLGLNQPYMYMMASYFGVDKSDLIEEYRPSTKQSQPYYALTPKDERDIAKELEEMIAELSNNGGSLAFSKEDEEFDEETRELLIASLEQSLRIAKMEAKKRFTPKKYRN